MEFVCYGNSAIEGTNKTFFEITQGASVTPKGDCVVGARANFDGEAIAALLQVANKVRITLIVGKEQEVVVGIPNKGFVPGTSLIVRKTSTATPNTIVLNADKAASDFSREFISIIKSPDAEIKVRIERA